MSLELASHAPFKAARARFAEQGRTQLAPVLGEDALGRVRRAIEDLPRWTLVTRLAGKHLDLDAAAMEALPAAQKAEFTRQVAAAAEAGFTYLYETYPIYDKAHAGVLRAESPALADLFDLLNSDTFLDPMRELTGAHDIAFADAQLTRYRAGHFLSTHDDGVAGKNRVAAYVLSLSERWQQSWGGTLDFLDASGTCTARFTPRPNTLSLFSVPQPHEVTPVRPRIRAARYSVTGWLRRGEDPGPA
ncbi:2OG-Fe(II) oxygenase [Maricaulis sp. CAU 1757]